MKPKYCEVNGRGGGRRGAKPPTKLILKTFH